MTTPAASASRREAAVRHAISWLQRAAGLGLFGCGLLYWVRIVGIYPGSEWRFDLMPLPWRIAAPTLAVMCPVAGVGLWLAASWGAVVWVMIAAFESVMHFALWPVFGGPGIELALHGAGLVMLGVLRLVHWRLSRQLRASRRSV